METNFVKFLEVWQRVMKIDPHNRVADNMRYLVETIYPVTDNDISIIEAEFNNVMTRLNCADIHEGSFNSDYINCIEVKYSNYDTELGELYNCLINGITVKVWQCKNNAEAWINSTIKHCNEKNYNFTIIRN